MIERACVVCSALSDQTRCPRHRRKDERPSAARRGYDARWRQVRARYLRENPACVVCGATATEVHHDFGNAGALRYDTRFLVALCKRCHTSHTQRERHRQQREYDSD